MPYRIDEDHFGARARRIALDAPYLPPREGDPLTLEDARRQREAELGRTLTRAESRQFEQGWRVGGLTWLADNIGTAGRYLAAGQVDALFEEINAVVQRYLPPPRRSD
jgi:hypothetical protein